MLSSFIKQLDSLTLKVPENLQLYGLYVYYVMHICDFGMLRVKMDDYLLSIIICPSLIDMSCLTICQE